MTPRTITVLIEGDESDQEAKLLSFSDEYKAGLYEVRDGRQFYVDPELIKLCQEGHDPVGIPLQVVTHREEMLAKLAWAQDQLGRLQKQNSTGLILPDGFKI